MPLPSAAKDLESGHLEQVQNTHVNVRELERFRMLVLSAEGTERKQQTPTTCNNELTPSEQEGRNRRSDGEFKSRDEKSDVKIVD